MTVIAIDGPAASGKSSVSRRLSKRLGFAYVNSGSLYRAATWDLLRQGTSTDSPDAITSAIARSTLSCTINSAAESDVLVEGRVVDQELRDQSINAHVSKVAAVPAVRSLVTNILRQLADSRSLVMEGRDIGSAVFPDARFKFYLDASPEVRNQRRSAEGLTDQIAARDLLDSSRKTSPLTIAPGALVIDTSHLSIDGVVNTIFDLLESGGLSHP